MRLDDRSERRAIVHIGLHKTGTTSFQKWADRWQENIAALAGVHYYQGRFDRSHFELGLLSHRANRSMAVRSRYPDWCLDEWQAHVRAHIRAEVERPVETLLCSTEVLSHLRHRDEVERLVELLAPRGLTVVVVLREPADFLASYAAELAKRGIQPSPYRDSFAYVESDSWLVRYDELIDVYSRVLGPQNVRALAYEDHVERDGSIIPALARACEIDPDEIPWQGIWRNTTPRTKANRGR